MQISLKCVSDHEKDPRRNMLKNWNGVNTIGGVFSGEFQLSDVPNLGIWTIQASVGSQVRTHALNDMSAK